MKKVVLFQDIPVDTDIWYENGEKAVINMKKDDEFIFVRTDYEKQHTYLIEPETQKIIVIHSNQLYLYANNYSLGEPVYIYPDYPDFEN